MKGPSLQETKNNKTKKISTLFLTICGEGGPKPAECTINLFLFTATIQESNQNTIRLKVIIFARGAKPVLSRARSDCQTHLGFLQPSFDLTGVATQF